MEPTSVVMFKSGSNVVLVTVFYVSFFSTLTLNILRSGAKDMKSSQKYPRAFGEQVAKHHLEFMRSESELLIGIFLFLLPKWKSIL